MLPYVNEPGKDEASINDERPESPSFYDEMAKKVKWYDKVLLNRPSKVVVTLLILAGVSPLLLYYFVLSTSLDFPPTDGYSIGSCLIPRESRIPCGYGKVRENECHLSCCFDEENGVCFHRLPSRFSYITDREWTEDLLLHPRVDTEPFSNRASKPRLRLSVNEISQTHVEFLIYDSDIVTVNPGKRLDDKMYRYIVSTPEFNLAVNVEDRIIFNTERGPLVAAENIWELAFKLTNETMYGLGEIPLNANTVKIIYNSVGSSYPIPIIFAKSNGLFHAFMVDNDSPTEIRILEDNRVLLRSIHLDSLKFHLFVGPTPNDIMKDVLELNGGPPTVDYWMLGTHFCSINSNSATDDLSKFLKEAELFEIPIDSHCGATPFIIQSNLDSEEMRLFEEGATVVVEAGKKFVPHIFPYIQYNKKDNVTNEARELELEDFITKHGALLIKDSNAVEPYKGYVNGRCMLYPDYEIENAVELIEFLGHVIQRANGFIFENTWPLDETELSTVEAFNYLPYFSADIISAFNNTLPWNVKHVSKSNEYKNHLYNHNQYGNNFVKTFEKIVPIATPLWSSSLWMNTKNIINRQNITASWANLRAELTQAALAAISGQWLSSFPVCGDSEDFNPETQLHLCLKWYLAQTYLPLFKVHSIGIDRDPLSFTGMTRAYIINSIKRRTSLLPYFYKVLQSGPLFRPMFYQYPQEEYLHDLTTQYHIGESILIVPNLLPIQSVVNFWMPPGVWYEMWSGLRIEANTGDVISMATAEADFVSLLRGGNIIVLQEEVKLSAEETRLKSRYSILVALDCDTKEDHLSNMTETSTDKCHASGTLYMSQNMSISFEADSETLTIRPIGNEWSVFCDTESAIWADSISEIRIYGLDNNLNNFDHYRQFSTSVFLCVLQMIGQNIVRFV